MEALAHRVFRYRFRRLRKSDGLCVVDLPVPRVTNVLILAWVYDAILPICRSPRSANSCDVLHPVCLPGLALVWRVRLLPAARCRSDIGPDEARPNSLSLDRIIPIESAHAIVEASNHGRIQWFGWCPAVEPPD